MDYYETELNRLLTEGNIITIQLSDGTGNKTKCLNLNKESIKALKKFLKKIK